MINHRTLFLIAASLLSATAVMAEDWPMWRYDAGRTAASQEQLPADLKLLWHRSLGPRRPAWDDTLNRDLMTYDRVFEPVVARGRLFVGFNDRDKLTAYDADTGAEQWSYFTDGPVRLPPVAWQDRVLFASDDGQLYCVDATHGKLMWRFRGCPNSRQIIGNQRLISAWPMRGGPVVRDGKVYVAASIWPFMGTFIYALEAETGAVVWVNDETGSQYIRQPHNAPSFAGVAPQGALVATRDVLLVPGGRSVPAALDRHSGKLLYFELAAGGKGTGGSFVAANDVSWFVHTRLRGTREFSLKTGVKTAFTPNEPVLAGNHIFSAEVDEGQAVVKAYDSQSKNVLWKIRADGRGDLILAGNTLYAAGVPVAAADGGKQSSLTAISLPVDQREARVAWTKSAPGTVERLLAANGKLIAVTLEGDVLAYGAGDADATIVLKESIAPLAIDTTAAARSQSLTQAVPASGFALWMGAANESLVSALAARSPFAELAIFDEDGERVGRLRRKIDAAGQYGRVTVHQTTSTDLSLPPYVANLVVIGSELAATVSRDGNLMQRWYESVRPYGGVLYLLCESADVAVVQQRLEAINLPQAKIAATSQGVTVTRDGPLPGAGDWTHQYGNIANTVKSDDRLVKMPLGVLWFGGVSHEDVLPRHGHGPPEQVIGGRLFIQGLNSITARDVYTGRVLWRREFKDLGTFDVYLDDTYKDTPLDPAYNQVHIPGANARGTNYVVCSDRIYIVEGPVCHVLDTVTGQSLADIQLPQEDPNRPRDWGYIGVYGDVLIGGVGFANYRSRHNLDPSGDASLSRSRAGFGTKSLDRAASMALVGFNRHTGQVLWRVDARHSFWHNGIVAGNGRIYGLDRNPKAVEDFLKRRGQSAPATYRLVAFEAQTGRLIWELPGEVFGTWLGYSEQHDLLLQAGASASDRLSSEVGQGMAVYRGKSGETVWKKSDLKYSGPCVLHHDLIITNANSYTDSAGAFLLQDGSQKMVPHPLTGALQPWKITRAYGCNSIIACENMLTFRSGAAGFYDLLTEAGTGNFGGFRSGCTANLIAADGVLNAPDYTRTCSCAYQNQTSLALVHMPEMDAWTMSNGVQLDPASGRVRQLGVNLGAPGDRRDPSGLLWLEYPPVAGDATSFSIDVEGDAKFYQDHSTSIPEAELPWVASSGVEGLTRLRLNLKSKDATESDRDEPYRLRLHFGTPRGSAEPLSFDVIVQGKETINNVRLGGDAPRWQVRTMDRIMLRDVVDIQFRPHAGRPVLSGIELHRLEQ